MKTALVIDDEPEIVELMKLALEGAGFGVSTASNGVEGLSRFKERPCDVVITDLLMPEKEGLETILELKGQNPRVKIVAISGGGRFGRSGMILPHAARFGADRTLAKPFAMRDLVRIVGELVGTAPGQGTAGQA